MLTEDQAFWFVVALFGLVAVMALVGGGWFGLLQVAIFSGVMISNALWQWTPNGYLAAMIGVGAAFLATVVISKSLLLWQRLRAREKATKQDLL
jgi:hypothetical protein